MFCRNRNEYVPYILKLFGAILLVIFTAVSTTARNQAKTDSLLSVIRMQEKTNKIDSTGVLALIQLSQMSFNKNYDRTLEYANKAIEWSHKIRFYRGESSSYTLKGNIYIQQGDYARALPNYQQSLKIANEHHLTSNLAKIYLDLGAMYMNVGDFYKSLSYELKAEKYDQMLNQKIELAKVLGNIGLLEYYMHDKNKAIQYLKESSEYADDNNEIQAQLDNNLGVIYREKGNEDQALMYQLNAKKLREQQHDSVGLAYSYFNIANIYLDKKNIAKALEYHKKAIALRKKLKLKKDLAYSYYELGLIYLKKKDYRKSKKYASMSYQIALSLQNLVNEQRSLELLADIYAEQNDFKTAYAYRKKYEVVNDSLFNKQKEKKFNNALKEYDINKKSQEIKLLQKNQELQQAKIRKDWVYNEALAGGSFALLLLVILVLNQYRIKIKSEHKLKKKNIELENAYKHIQESELLLKEHNDKLAKLNDEKNEFVHIVAHDLRNPLVGISGMVKIMNDVEAYFAKYSKEDIKTHTQLILNSTDQMQSLVKSLLDVNRIESGKPIDLTESVDISDVIASVAESQSKMAADKNIQIELDVEDNIVIQGNEGSFRQIFDNLLSNALKYSPLNSKVWIESSVGNSKATIFFRDSGPGITEKDQEQLFKKFTKLSSKPTNNETSTGLGLYITKKLVNSMSGSVYYNPEYTYGSEFVVEFPLIKSH